MKLAASSIWWTTLESPAEAPASAGSSSTSALPPSAPTGSEAAPAPAATGTEIEGEDEPSEEVWGFLADTAEGNEAAEERAPIEGAPPAAATEPKPETKETSPAAAPPAPATEVKLGEQPPPAAEVIPPPTAEAPPAQQTPEQQKKALEEAEAAYVVELERFYELPETEAVAFETEPEKVLPRLAAKLHQAMERAVMARVQLAIPHMIQVHLTQNEAGTKAKDAFYQRWPDLAQFEPQVMEMGQLFRKTNLKATPEEAIERVGAMVYAALGRAPASAPAAATAAVPASGASRPSAPQAPAAAAGGFRPAMPGAGGTAALPAKSENEFANLAEEFLEEDRA